MIKIICFIFIVLFMPLGAEAHSGGTNAEGCHTNRKTGEAHCHNKKLKSPPAENKEPVSKTGNRTLSRKESPTREQNQNRIFQWIDAKGEIHYSNDLQEVPVSARESLHSK